MCVRRVVRSCRRCPPLFSQFAYLGLIFVPKHDEFAMSSYILSLFGYESEHRDVWIQSIHFRPPPHFLQKECGQLDFEALPAAAHTECLRKWRVSVFSQKIFNFIVIATFVNNLLRALIPVILQSVLCKPLKDCCRSCNLRCRGACKVQRKATAGMTELLQEEQVVEDLHVPREVLQKLLYETDRKPYTTFQFFGEQAALLALVTMFSPTTFQVNPMGSGRLELPPLCSLSRSP